MKASTLAIIIIVILALAGGWYLFASVGSGEPEAQGDSGDVVVTISDEDAFPLPEGGMETGTIEEIEAIEDKIGTIETGTVETGAGPVATVPEKNFTVTGYNFGFTPNAITVQKGDRVTIEFANAGGFHDFVIDEFNVRTSRLEGGATTSVTFVATKAGTFQYYCSVSNHRAEGMWGSLVVTE